MPTIRPYKFLQSLNDCKRFFITSIVGEFAHLYQLGDSVTRHEYRKAVHVLISRDIRHGLSIHQYGHRKGTHRLGLLPFGLDISDAL